MIKLPAVFLSIAALFFYNKSVDDSFTKHERPEKEIITFIKEMDFLSLRDTLYTFEPYFIEVNLDSQMGYLHSKDGSVEEFGVSSGNKRLLDAVETNEGLFVIQSKMPKWHSRQFDSTLMINWMGFNFGIGFHALAGNSYYKYLGKNKSSHGCLRISREIAKRIYSLINFGTPVLVHNGNNAVHIGFADSSRFYEYTSYDYNTLLKILPERFNTIYEGEYFITEKPKLLINLQNVKHTGLPIGDRNRIPRRQLVKPFYLFVESVIPDKINVDKIKRENADSTYIISLQK
jgi:hypothetical protein